MWTILIIVVIIGAVLGALLSDENKGENALLAGCTSGIGCGYFLLQIILLAAIVLFGVWLIKSIF